MKRFHFAIGVLALISYFPAVLSYYRVFYILIALVFCFGLFLAWVGYVARGGMWKNSRLLVVFFLYLSFTALWAQVPRRTLVGVAIASIFLLVFAIGFLLKLNHSEKEIAQIFLWIPYTVAVTFGYLLARFGALRPYDQESAAAFGATANLCVQWLLVSLPFIFWLIRQGDKRRYFEFSLGLLLIVVGQSRTGYLLVVLWLLMEAYLYGRGARRFFAKAIQLSMAVLMLVGLAWLLPVTRPLLEEGYSRTVVSENFNETDINVERLWMLRQGWESFTEHPILGIGYDNLGERVADNYGYEVVSHNLLVTLLAECGWPGFVLFIFLIREFLKRTQWARSNGETRTRGFYTACLLSMIVALLTGMFFPLLQFPLFYVVLGIGYAVKWKPRGPAQGTGSLPLLSPA